jgi:hypothetical protein
LAKEISDFEEEIEATRTHQESPVQIRDLPEDQAAREKGTLLFQQTDLLMK